MDEDRKPRKKVAPEELERRAASVLRVIREKPGLSAAAIGRTLGDVPAREVRERVRLLRRNGEPITIGLNGHGYHHLETIPSDAARVDYVKAHRARSREYLVDHARLMRQIGHMTAVEIAQHALFDVLVPDDPHAGHGQERPGTMADLARLPAERRAGVTRLLIHLLEGIERDPEAFCYERAVLADKFRGIFLTKSEAGKLAQARKLLEEVGV